jgi:enoyl-CoA hydratase
MTLETLLVEISDAVALVTINRPDRLNALNARAKSELRELFVGFRDDPAVDVVILTGAGTKAFVAGTDIAELSALNGTSGKAFSSGGQEAFNAVENLGKPVIAAVNGFALGGGCELALACHIRLAAENARFGQPEVNLGIIPGYGGTQRLPRLVGSGRAAELILSGNPIDAQEALRIGLVNRVVPQADLLATARELAGQIASRGQVAVRLALRALAAARESGLAAGLKEEATLFGACCESEDFREGTAAFLAKRKPAFRNR